MGIRSNNWKYRIEIKDQFDEETTPELIVKLCTSLSSQLGEIKGFIENDFEVEVGEELISSLDENIDNFDHLKHLADGTIPEDEWADYSFDGDFETDFNGYLSQLYDLADDRVTNKNGIDEKFIWIG